ncbi:MAG TPA: hypothetical protein P5117_13225, partial [Spirochaetia bacterium]|nr:hypothetical protein [Spirochaetia bacterium]
MDERLPLPPRIGIYEKALPAGLDWPGMLRAAREAGYDYVEMSVDETDAPLARLEAGVPAVGHRPERSARQGRGRGQRTQRRERAVRLRPRPRDARRFGGRERREAH